MIFLRVSVDQSVLAVVSTEGRDVVSVQIGGARIDEDFATVSVMGGIYDRDGVTEHRIWVDEHVLEAGQSVEICVLPEATESNPGVHLPGSTEHVPEHSRSADLADLIAEVRQQKAVRDRYLLRIESSRASSREYSTEKGEHGFGVGVLWNWKHPERASMSAHAYTLDSIEAGESGRSFAQEYLHAGDWVRVTVMP